MAKRRGRPGPCVRRKLRIACDRIVRRLTVREVALIHAISHRTVIRWTQQALESDEPEAEGLRRLKGSNHPVGYGASGITCRTRSGRVA